MFLEPFQSWFEEANSKFELQSNKLWHESEYLYNNQENTKSTKRGRLYYDKEKYQEMVRLKFCYYSWLLLDSGSICNPRSVQNYLGSYYTIFLIYYKVWLLSISYLSDTYIWLTYIKSVCLIKMELSIKMEIKTIINLA